MATTTAPRIGFVGLGHMGGNMAARFLAAGYPVYGGARTQAHSQRLVHDGLVWCNTPREVAESAEIVFTSVPDDGVLEVVASGPDGILVQRCRRSRARSGRISSVEGRETSAPAPPNVSGRVPRPSKYRMCLA